MVTLLPKKEGEKPVFSPKLVQGNSYSVAAGGVLILLISVYFGLAWYAKFLKDKTGEAEAKIKKVEEMRDSKLEQKVIDFASRLKGIEFLLDSRVYSSKIFPFIEGIAHPQAQFVNFTLDTRGGLISIKAATRDYTTLGEQITALRQNKELKNLEISGINLEKTGNITFDVRFEVDESIYR